MPGGGGACRRVVAVAVTGLALAGLVACGETSEPAPRGGIPVAQTPRQPSIAEQQQAVGASVAKGYGIRIDKIGAQSDLIDLGLNGDGTIQVPPLNDVAQAGLYKNGPKPGQVGPAVVLGHVNGGGEQGVFARLAELRDGDVAVATTPQGEVKFKVYQVRTVAKSRFPTAEVYGDTATPELRLITCGPGAMDSAGANYLNQSIVWAKKID